jgi:hypothetical protein
MKVKVIFRVDAIDQMRGTVQVSTSASVDGEAVEFVEGGEVLTNFLRQGDAVTISVPIYEPRRIGTDKEPNSAPLRKRGWLERLLGVAP